VAEREAQNQDMPPLGANRDFRLLWLGSGVSVLGSRASAIAYPLLVLALTGSAADAGLVGFAATIPYLLLQLPAGALVDRWNRKHVMIACDAGRAVAVGSIVLALALDRISFAQIMAVSFIEGSLYVFHSLAEPATVRNIVHSHHLPVAMSQIEAANGAPPCSASPSAASCSTSAAPCRSLPIRSPIWRHSPRCC